MKNNPEILNRIGRRDGMKVPEGYFEDFARRMDAALPPRPEATSPGVVQMHRSAWQRVRPYVYMAAMFAGVWCMLKMFSLMQPASSPTPMEANPIMAEALANHDFVNEFVVDEVNQWDLYDEMVEDGIDIDAFCDSLGASLNQE